MRVTWPDGSVSSVPSTAPALTAALRRLTRIATSDLAGVHGDWPSLYEQAQSGHVAYERESPRERWLSPSQLIEGGRGDCEDLAAMRAAELRLEGEDAWAVPKRTGPHSWHAVVRRGDGSIEDPTRELREMGAYIGAEDEMAQTQVPRSIEWEASPSQTVRGGWRGVIRINMTDGGQHVVQRGGTSRQHALRRAAGAATSLLDSPVARALLPPQAAMALQLLRTPAARSVTRGVQRLFRSIF